MKKFIIYFLYFLFVVISSCNTSTPELPQQLPENKNTQTPEHQNKEGDKHGHNKANQHMHHAPVSDLIKSFESEERAKTQKPYEVIALLGDIQGKKILDIGAGSGYFSYKMAEKGAKVVAGDVNDEFLNYIRQKNEKIKIKNGSVTAKKLPFDNPVMQPEEMDEVIIVNTYHHIENRIAYFNKVLQGLKPEGKLMVVDFKKLHFHEKVDGPPYEMRIAAQTVEEELKKAGFTKFELNQDLLPFQYVLIAYKDSNQPKTDRMSSEEEFKLLKTNKINMKIKAYKRDLSPKEIMKLYYPLSPNPNEGKEKIMINTKDLSNGNVEVVLIHDNLLDDSMRGKKIVMELQKRGAKWFVKTLKKNWKCWSNRGHQGWGIENCN